MNEMMGSNYPITILAMMGSKYDFKVVAFLVFLLTFVIIMRQYDDKMRKKRLVAKKKFRKVLIGIKQYSIILVVSAAIAALIMLIVSLTIWEEN
jgi:hypothetical protein